MTRRGAAPDAATTAPAARPLAAGAQRRNQAVPLLGRAVGPGEEAGLLRDGCPELVAAPARDLEHPLAQNRFRRTNRR